MAMIFFIDILLPENGFSFILPPEKGIVNKNVAAGEGLWYSDIIPMQGGPPVEKYAISREFFPWNLFAPPISEKFLALSVPHMKPPKRLWRKRPGGLFPVPADRGKDHRH